MNGFATQARRHSAVLLAAALALGGCGGSDGPVSGAAAYAHVESMVALGPRPPGSPALRQNADYLKSEISKLGLKPREQVWDEVVEVYGQERTVQMRNVWTTIDGKDPENGPILLLAAHYDTKLCEGHPKPSAAMCMKNHQQWVCPQHNFRFVGAIDGAGASAVLLELARVLAERPANGPNIWMVWFDGEECLEYHWVDEKALFGSRYFAKKMAADKKQFPKGLSARMKAMVLLDLIGSHNIKIDKDILSSTTLLDIFGKTAEAMGEKERMYRYESPMTDDHKPFKDLGVTVIDLIDFKWRTPLDPSKRLSDYPGAPPEGEYAVWWHTPEDDMHNVSADALAFAGNLVWNALPEIEKTIYGVGK